MQLSFVTWSYVTLCIQMFKFRTCWISTKIMIILYYKAILCICPYDKGENLLSSNPVVSCCRCLPSFLFGLCHLSLEKVIIQIWVHLCSLLLDWGEAGWICGQWRFVTSSGKWVLLEKKPTCLGPTHIRSVNEMVQTQPDISWPTSNP